MTEGIKAIGILGAVLLTMWAGGVAIGLACAVLRIG